jgi:hypothetical protein
MQVLKPHPNISYPEMYRVLCILQPVKIHPVWEKMIAGKPINELNFSILTRFQKILLLKSRRQLLSANPRSVSYMLTLVHEFIKEHAPSASIDLLIYPEFETEIPAFLKKWPQQILVGHIIADTQKSKNLLRTYDVIILLFPDAIGLGWGNIERRLLRLNNQTILVINGRRRVFILDRKMRGALILRRFLDVSCLVEIILCISIFPVATLTAGYDVLIHWKTQLRGS